MKQKDNIPIISWIKITDYMHSWLQDELGGVRIRDQRMVSLQYLPGAKNVLRMETENDMQEHSIIVKSMSDRRMNCVRASISFDPNITKQLYNITAEDIKLFLPIESPKMCVNEYGAIRPWTHDICMGRVMATKMQHIVREAFWTAVGTFAKEYAIEHSNEHYAQVEMIEAFCDKTSTQKQYVETIRREWQRRCKRSI